MHYKGRLTAVAFILFFRGVWFYYYNSLYGHTLHFSEVTITILLLFPAWWIGKQFDQVSELKQKLELRKEKLLKEIRVSENRYNNFVEKSPNFVVIYDTQGKITYANKKTLSLLEAENESEVLGKSMLDFIDPIQHDEGRKRLNDALQHIPVEPIEYKVITLKKRIIYIQSVVMQITDEGKQALMFVALDVTKRKEAEMLRNQQERNYESLVKTSPIGIIVHKNEKIIWVNPAALKIAGVQHEHDLIGTSLTKLIEPTKINIINERIQKIEQGHQVKPIEYKIIRPDGSFIYAEINGYKTNFQGQDVILSFAVDITERKKQIEKINELAYYDTLTSLPNRNMLTRHLESAITDAIENGKKGYTLFLDLDRFKNINDTYGHSSGDELLKKVTEKLKSMSLLKNEFISRYGGDEFIIVINSNKSISEVAYIAEEISSILRKPVFVRGLPMYISTSIGISIFPRDGQDSDTLIKNADIAMYTAKESGRDNYKFYSNNLYEENVRRMEIERELRTAIEKKQLFLQYQPKVEIKTNKVIGSEALLRWKHPTLGFISPAEFIPIAEETGLIIPIGEWVLKEAIAQTRKWIDEGWHDVKTAINVSVLQLQRPKFPQELRKILEDENCHGSKIEIEITESLLRDSKSIKSIKRIKKMGVKIAIDDFGTGYSSLSTLKHVPIDCLKIDKSFIDDIHTQNEAIVKTIIDMGSNLNCKIVAEGVETREQVEFLQQLDCHYIQGYYYSKPVLASEIPKIKKTIQQDTQFI